MNKIPKHLTKYVRFSIEKYATPLIRERKQKVDVYQKMYDSNKSEPLLNLIECWKEELEIIESLCGSYFVEEYLCDDGVYVDEIGYLRDKIIEIDYSISQLEEMKSMVDAEYLLLVEKELLEKKRYKMNCKNKIKKLEYNNKVRKAHWEINHD